MQAIFEHVIVIFSKENFNHMLLVEVVSFSVQKSREKPPIAKLADNDFYILFYFMQANQ